MKKNKFFLALMGAILLSANVLAGGPLYDENGFAINPENPNQYQEPTVTDGVYQIANAGNLYWFADFVNQGGTNASANAVLANDITINENLLSSLVINGDGNVTNGSDFKAWTPIGTKNNLYTGTFDGKGYTVSGLYFNDGTKDYVGLFGRISSGATVQNVGVVDSYFKGDYYVGGVVGGNDGGTISNVYNTGSVNGEQEVGGVVGTSFNGTVSNVYNTGVVSGSGGVVGGVVGNSFDGTVSNVYNTGSVSGTENVGGVVGNSFDGTVSNVYNTGSVNGSGYNVGGVVGFNDGTVSNGFFNTAYYSGDAIGFSIGTADNVKGLSMAELSTLTIGSKADADADFPLLEGEEESPWAKGIYYDKATGKLANSNLPYLKSLPKPQDVEMEVKDNVIQISSTDDLKNFAKLVNEYHITDVDAELTTNLTVNSNLLGENNANVDAETGEYTGNTPANVWTPIGSYDNSYQGIFDGNGYTIRGLYFNDENTEFVGLFGYIGSGATVQNVGVVDSYFKGYQGVGGVVGYNYNGTVSNVYNTGSVNGEQEIGGVVGWNYGGTVSNAYNTGSVNGKKEVGGVVGYNFYGTVSNVYNTGSVDGSFRVGGVVGDGYGGEINNAYYDNQTCNNCNSYGTGKTLAELANLTVGNGGDFPLLEGEEESPWVEGSEKPVVSNGKLLYKFPGLKIFGSQPEGVLFNVQKGSDEKDYCEIVNADDLFKFAQLVNDGATGLNAKLTADICVNGCGEGESVLKADGSLNGDGSNFTPWIPIGTEDQKFKGTFDGAGHTISGLYFNDESTEYVGLFGYIDESAKVQNVGVVDSYFKGYQYVGGVVGYNKGTVSNVYNTGAVSGETFVGGVVGYNDGGTVSNAYNTGSVSGSGDYVGGVVGNNYGTVSNAYNTGSVSGSGDNVGGVVGYSFNGTVSNVYNTGFVSGNGVGVGGVVGNNYGTVSNVYNTGSVNGTDGYVGGVVGDNDGGTVSNGFFNTAYYSGNAIGSGAGTADNVKGLSMTDLANLTVGNGGDFPLLEGETESPWVEGSEKPVVSNGKLVYKFPGLKIFDSQPEVVLFNVQKGSDGKDYCEIANADDLFKFAQLVNDGATGLNAKLTADICVNGCGEGEKSLLEQVAELEAKGELLPESFKQWIPIGTETQKFKGTFDGAGHTISGLYFNQDESNAGLFGRSTVGGSIKNVGVVDSYIKGKNNVGGIVGHNGNCTVSNVFSTSTVEGGECVGGIAGYNDAGTIENAYNMGAVSGNSKVAGIAGYNLGTSAHINNVYSSGTVSGPKNKYVYGLVGYNSAKKYINYAFYNTDVFSEKAVGNVDGTNVEGKTTVELASTTLPEGFSSEIWLAGSKDVVDGKLVYKFPGLKIFNSQPEVVLFIVQKGSDGKDYCEIANADDLFKFAQLVNGGATGLNAKLTADICVNGCGEGEKSLLEQVAELEANDELSPESFQQWTPMSVPKNVTVAFDGNGHTISGLYFNKEKSSQIGLFGQVVGDVSVSNLGVVDFYVNGNGEVGSLAGQVTGKLNIKNCYSAGSVKGEHYIGGIVGVNRGGAELKIENSYNESSVNAPAGVVGGLVGENYNYASLTITNSYNAGAVSGIKYVGGLVGDNYSAILTIENSYNVGAVSGTQYAGGLVGVNEDGTLNVSNSFFVETNGDGDGLAGEAKTSDEFANGTVTDLLNTGQSPVVWVQGKEYPILKDNHIHYSYENGFCVCGNYEQPVQDENGVYQISNAGELYWFADFVNQGGDNAKANAILTNNIVVNTLEFKDGEIVTDNKDYKEWNPIGIDDYYQGIFDGNGHTISGLYFNDSDEWYVGLFASNDGTIQNVGVVGSYFYGHQCVGGVCGNNNKGTISNCYNTSTVRGNNNIGGVSGFNFEGKIENCYNTGAVSGLGFVGEVCGSYNDVTNCYYLSDTDTGDGDGVYGKTAEQFANGTVAKLLYDGENGSIWGQNTSTDTVPNFSGKILFKVTLAAENGTAENGLGEYNKKYEIKATANTGYHFVEWSNGSTEIKDSILVVNDTALVATFEAHSFGNWDTTSVATCTTLGMRSHICSCGVFEDDTIDVLPHAIVIDTLIPATCTHWGLKEGSHCSVCKTVLVKQDTIEALGHKVVTDAAVTATCTHFGLKEGSHCSVCKTVLVKQDTIEALGHKVVTDAAVTATCTHFGLKEGSHCSVCETILVKQDTIEALGHSFTLYVYNDDATTEADGTKTAACDHEGCDETDTQVAVGTKLEPTLSEKTEGDNISIYTFGRSIVVENADADINVYDVTGRLVARRVGVHSVSERIEVPNIGVYVVKCGNMVKRVSVIQ